MRISDWSSDVCSSDLTRPDHVADHDLSPVAADRLFGDRAEICAPRCRSRSAIELPDLIRGLCFVSSVRSIDPLFRAAARIPSLWTRKEQELALRGENKRAIRKRRKGDRNSVGQGKRVTVLV